MKRNIANLVLAVAAAFMPGANTLAADVPAAVEQQDSVEECMRKLTENAKKRHAEQSENRIKRGLKPYRFTPPGVFQKTSCGAKQKSSILNNTSWQ